MTKRGLNLAFITDTFCPDINGPSTYLKIIIGELAKRGHKVVIYTHKNAINPFDTEKVKVVKLPSVKLLTYNAIQVCIPNPVKLRSSLITQNPDIVHVHSLASPLSVEAMIIAKSKKMPVVATFHGFLDRYEYYLSFFRMLKGVRIPFGRNFLRALTAKMPVKLPAGVEVKKRLIWQVLRAIYNKCDLVIVPSALSAKKVASHHIPCIAIPCGVDVDTFRVKRSYARTGKILSVCRLGYEKNLDILMRAFSLFAKKHPKSRLTLVGDGPARDSLVELTRNLGLQDRVSFEGMVKRSKLQKYFDSHDFFANASDSETFGYVTAEAMAAGLPIVAVDATGSRDLVRHRINGFLAKPNSIEDFASAMEKMMGKETDLRSMGTASRRLVQNFSVEKCLEMHIKAYMKVVNGKE